MPLPQTDHIGPWCCRPERFPPCHQRASGYGPGHGSRSGRRTLADHRSHASLRAGDCRADDAGLPDHAAARPDRHRRDRPHWNGSKPGRPCHCSRPIRSAVCQSQFSAHLDHSARCTGRGPPGRHRGFCRLLAIDGAVGRLRAARPGIVASDRAWRARADRSRGRGCTGSVHIYHYPHPGRAADTVELHPAWLRAGARHGLGGTGAADPAERRQHRHVDHARHHIRMGHCRRCLGHGDRRGGCSSCRPRWRC